jgi:hypothetical protein
MCRAPAQVNEFMVQIIKIIMTNYFKFCVENGKSVIPFTRELSLLDTCYCSH